MDRKRGHNLVFYVIKKAKIQDYSDSLVYQPVFCNNELRFQLNRKLRWMVTPVNDNYPFHSQINKLSMASQ